MSQLRRSDLAAGGPPVTDDNAKFKKPFQTIGRPEVTDHNINDEYFRDPPNNQPIDPSQDRKPLGKREGAYDFEQSNESPVMGEDAEAFGRVKKVDVLSEATQETSVHPNS